EAEPPRAPLALHDPPPPEAEPPCGPVADQDPPPPEAEPPRLPLALQPNAFDAVAATSNALRETMVNRFIAWLLSAWSQASLPRPVSAQPAPCRPAVETRILHRTCGY